MIEITQENIREALKRPSDFGLSSKNPHFLEMFHTWSLGPVIRHRDSGLLTQVNADALEAHLHEDHPELENEWEITTCSHWGVGWVDHLSFHAVNEKGEPTKIFQVLKEWDASLTDYPCADDEELSKREYEDTLENIKNEGQPSKKAPKYWETKVFDWLWENDQRAIDPVDEHGGYPSREAVNKALSVLGWLEKDEDEELCNNPSVEG